MDIQKVKRSTYVGEVFQNPKKGTSTVTRISDCCIYYIRGKSTIPLPINAYIDVCKKYKGQICCSTDLINYLPNVFSTKHNGHDCNRTFLFLLAEKMQLLEGGIMGKGEPGNAFYVKFK